MVGRGIIGLVCRRPGVARVFHLVGMDRSPGIGKAGIGHRQRVGVFNFHRVATGLGRCFGPVEVRGFVEISHHKNRGVFVWNSLNLLKKF